MNGIDMKIASLSDLNDRDDHASLTSPSLVPSNNAEIVGRSVDSSDENSGKEINNENFYLRHGSTRDGASSTRGYSRYFSFSSLKRISKYQRFVWDVLQRPFLETSSNDYLFSSKAFLSQPAFSGDLSSPCKVYVCDTHILAINLEFQKIIAIADIDKCSPLAYDGFFYRVALEFHGDGKCIAFAFYRSKQQQSFAEIIQSRSLALRDKYHNIDATTVPSRPLHFCCLTIGSRGDIQPFLSLGKTLQKHGHRCTIVTHDEYRAWVVGHGLEFRHVSGNPEDLMQLCIHNGMFSLSFFREASSKLRNWIDDLLVTSYDAMKDCDVIIGSPVSMAGLHIAEKLNIPYFNAFPMPWSRTNEFPHPFATVGNSLGKRYNWFTWAIMENTLGIALLPQINKFRKATLGLPPCSSNFYFKQDQIPHLYPFSDIIVKRPGDWNDNIHITGYWFLDSPDLQWSPPTELSDFMERARRENKRLIYIGFGSIIVENPDKLTADIVESVNNAGVMAIITRGWSDRTKRYNHEEFDHLKKHLSNVFILKSLPHDWLFPKVDVVIHHGGAGTTAAALRYGKPSIIKPFFGDQFFWANRMSELGCGLRLKKLDVESLTQAIREVASDEKMKEKAKSIGKKISEENGAETAVRIIFDKLKGIEKYPRS